MGTDYVAKSAPDGHTLMINSTQFVQSPATFAKLRHDSHADIVPITRITISLRACVRSEIDRWKKVASAAGAKPQ